MSTPAKISSPTAVRAVLGGILMGLANLVPGISGGTMLLASGIYTQFVDSIAELSTLRLRWRPILLLGLVAGSALVAIVLLAGPVKDLVVERRWMMYSLFIGLTLGGIPVVWRLLRPATAAVWGGAVVGLIGMIALALSQAGGHGTTGAAGSNFLLLFLGGLAGASAMILPGVSGGYLLLVLGQYVPILSAIEQFRSADRWSEMLGPGLHVLLPVGLGVVVGVVGVSNLLRWLLRRFEKATLGVLLGLLVGAVAGLWPFQASVDPILGQTVIKGQVVTVDNFAQFDAEDYPTAYFRPGARQVAGSMGLILLGIAATSLLARIGGGGKDPADQPSNSV